MHGVHQTPFINRLPSFGFKQNFVQAESDIEGPLMGSLRLFVTYLSVAVMGIKFVLIAVLARVSQERLRDIDTSTPKLYETKLPDEELHNTVF
jgi:hypothetical protein